MSTTFVNPHDIIKINVYITITEIWHKLCKCPLQFSYTMSTDKIYINIHYFHKSPQASLKLLSSAIYISLNCVN